MPRLLGLKDLRERKAVLAAESEIYRETLRLEAQNLRLYTARVRRKLEFLKAANPLLAWAPLLGALGNLVFRKKREKRRRGWLGMAGAALSWWRTYRHYRPVVEAVLAQNLLGRLFGRARPPREGADEPGPNR